MKRHTHRVDTLTVRPFFGGVSSARPNPAAHGNITVHDRCCCGATRLTNVNQMHIERGQWSCSADDERLT